MRCLALSSVALALCGIAGATYTTVTSRFNTNDTIRFKKFENGELCNGGGTHYTGWADVGDRHLFYWYHPVRHNIKDAPLMIWLQGGPGGSSLVGMLVEHGPCISSLDTQETVFNPYAWTESYNVIYLDQPASVGFSYLSDPQNVTTYPRRTEEAALDFIRALRLFPEAFPELDQLPIYIAGESYAGRYIPEFGAAVLEYNSHVPRSAQIPLASLMIGNGLINAGDQWPAFYDTGCFVHHGIEPIFNQTECAKLAVAANRCEKLSKSCVADPDELICRASGDYCDKTLWDIIETKSIDRYDRTRICPAPGQCYPHVDKAETWLNSGPVLETLEVQSQTDNLVSKWQMTSQIISSRFKESADFHTSSVPALQRVLEANLDVLIYVGVNDWACNAVGVKRLLDNLYWKHHAQFRGEPMVDLPWTIENRTVAGYTKAVDNLHYVELLGGGHLIPFNQPVSTLTMVQIWLQRVKVRKYVRDRGDNSIKRVPTVLQHLLQYI